MDRLPKVNLYESCRRINIRCCLHTICNMKCKFCCFQESKAKIINIDYIQSLPDKIVKVVQPSIDKYNMTTIQLSLFGGELFQDNFDDYIFELYFELIKEIRLKLSDIQYRVDIITNGMFKNHKRVNRLLKNIRAVTDICELILSYDSMNRFTNKNQKQKWLDTFNYFRDQITGIATILTKGNIQSYINTDEVFEYITKNFNSVIDVTYYKLIGNHRDDLPDIDDFYNFYKWALDHQKFNISDIGVILERYINIDVERAHTYNLEYCFSEAIEKQFNQIYVENNDQIYKQINCKITDRHQCLYCQNYNDCPEVFFQKKCLGCQYYNNCLMVPSWVFLSDQYQFQKCPIQKIYTYINNNPQIIENYRVWENN